MFYVDTSAAMKLVVDESGSQALGRWLEPRAERLCGSDLLRIELLRATKRATPLRMVRAREVLESVVLLPLSTAICERAATLEPGALRSLDALHLAAAMEVGDELEGFVTYDTRLAQAVQANGVKAVTPR